MDDVVVIYIDSAGGGVEKGRGSVLILVLFFK